MKLLLLLLIAAAAVVTLPFIKRQMILGLVEGVLQLGDAPPAIAQIPVCRTSDYFDRTGGFQQATLRLLLVALSSVVMPQVLLPDVVLVQVELVLVFVVFRGGGNVPLLGVAAVLGTDRSR